MYYSKSTGGFYSRDIHGGNIPPDAVEITADAHRALLEGQSTGIVIVSDADGFPALANAPIVQPQTPTVVSMRQARLALHASGLLASVEAAINAMEEPQKTTARIEWDYASEVHRASKFVTLLGAALGLDEQSLDDLFLKAREL